MHSEQRFQSREALDHIAHLGLNHVETMENRILSMRNSHFTYEPWQVLWEAQILGWIFLGICIYIYTIVYEYIEIYPSLGQVYPQSRGSCSSGSFVSILKQHDVRSLQLDDFQPITTLRCRSKVLELLIGNIGNTSLSQLCLWQITVLPHCEQPVVPGYLACVPHFRVSYGLNELDVNLGTVCALHNFDVLSGLVWSSVFANL